MRKLCESGVSFQTADPLLQKLVDTAEKRVWRT